MTNISLVHVSCLIILFCAIKFAYGGLAYRDCGGSLMSFTKIAVEPLPFHITRNSTTYVTLDFTMNRDAPEDAELELKIDKIIRFGGTIFTVPIPCIKGYGSCRMALCDALKLDLDEVFCPFFVSNNQTCACPLRKGHYSSSGIEVKLPFEKFQTLLLMFANTFASGYYRILLTISNRTNSNAVYACLSIAMHMTLDL